MNPTSPPAYWLLSDDQLPLAIDPLHADHLRASLIHTLLFEDHVVTTDSYAVNNRNFRAVIQGNPPFLEILKRPWFKIASRIGNTGSRRALLDVRDEFHREKRFPSHFPEKEYQESGDLTLLESGCHFIDYSVDRLSERFTREVARLFQRAVVRDMLNAPLVDEINRFVEDKQQARVRLRLTDFWILNGELGLRVDQALGRGTWEENLKTVRGIASAPHLTGLPEEIVANPIYAPQHSFAISLWRERLLTNDQPLQDPYRFETRLGLSTFVHALCLATDADIEKLRATDECRSHHDAIRRLSVADESLATLRRSYRDYRRQVELVLARKVGVHSLGNPHTIEIRNAYHETLAEKPSKKRAFISAAATVVDFTLHALGIPIPVGGMTHTFHELTHAPHDKEESVARAKAIRQEALDEQEAIDEAVEKLSQRAAIKGQHPPQLQTQLTYHAHERRDVLIRESPVPPQ